jgi:hypothetical protein
MDLSVAQIYDQRKYDAYSFLKHLEKTLNSTIPPPTELRAEIRKTVADSKASDSQKHMRRPEEAFLNLYVVPEISRFLKSHLGMGENSAHRALLSENYRNMRRFCSDTPARTQRHPFGKVTGVNTRSIMRQWKSGRDNALTPRWRRGSHDGFGERRL